MPEPQTITIACPRCRKKYRIRIRKPNSAAIRFSCRHCGGSVLVKLRRSTRVQKQTTTQTAHDTRSGPTRAPGRSAARVPEGQANGAAKGAVSTSSAGTHATTRTDGLPRIPSRPVAARDVWFAIRKGERVGPFTREKLLEQLLDGVLQERSFVWRPTMSKWMRMSQVEELEDVLRRFNELKQREVQETVVTPLLLGGDTSAAKKGASPPPLPKDPAPQGQTGRTQEPAEGLADIDELYRGISRPAIDIRKGGEVQDEEPEIPDSRRSAAAWTTDQAQAKTSLVQGEQGHGKEGLAESHAEKRFFSRAFVLPEARWPKGQAEVLPRVETAATRRTVRETTKPREERLSLRDFSVMFRLSRKSRRKTIVVVSAFAGLVGVAVAAVSYWALSSELRKKAVHERPTGDSWLNFRQQMYPVMKAAREAEEAARQAARKGDRRHRNRRRQHASELKRRSNARRAQDAGEDPDILPRPAAPTRLAVVDDDIKAQYQLYGSLLSTDKRREPKVEVKPLTTVQMPKFTFSKEEIDEFLQRKAKKFLFCRRKLAGASQGMQLKILLDFTVGKNGRVTQVQVNHEFGPANEDFDHCVRKLVRGWIFPPQKQVVRVKRSLVL